MGSKVSDLTALTGANTATGDLFYIVDVSDGTSGGKKITRAELENAMRAANAAAQIVTLSGATSITAATHGNRTGYLTGTGSSLAQTLPAAAGTGYRYHFIVGAVNTSNHVIKVANSSDTIKGNVTILDADGTTISAYQASGTDDTLTLNGTTTGGQIGDWVELIDVATNVWALRAMLTCPAGSNPADPLSATV